MLESNEQSVGDGTSDGMMERKIGRWIGWWHLQESSRSNKTIVVMAELSQLIKFSVYQSIFIPTFTYGHEF